MDSYDFIWHIMVSFLSFSFLLTFGSLAVALTTHVLWFVFFVSCVCLMFSSMSHVLLMSPFTSQARLSVESEPGVSWLQ